MKLLSFFILVHIQLAFALKNYRFREGSDASIDFSLEIQKTSTEIRFEMFTLNSEHPFYTNRELNPSALQPDQQERFQVTHSQRDRNFTATLIINNIQENDKGVYILIVQEGNGQTEDHILDANVDVITPPGKAECRVINTNYSAQLRQVECRATASNDESASLMCYQKSEKAPLYEPITYSSSHIIAFFWMNVKYPINCCSLDSMSIHIPASCSDFVLPFPQLTSTAPKQQEDDTHFSISKNA